MYFHFYAGYGTAEKQKRSLHQQAGLLWNEINNRMKTVTQNGPKGGAWQYCYGRQLAQGGPSLQPHLGMVIIKQAVRFHVWKLDAVSREAAQALSYFLDLLLSSVLREVGTTVVISVIMVFSPGP